MTGEAVCLYLRVSTSQQAQHDLSIPDQRNRILEYAQQQGWHVVAEFVEAGASARDDQRPIFQEMIGAGLTRPPKFTRILVHSMSRIFRDEMYYEMYRRKLDKNGVQIVSITQNFGEGPGGDLTRRIMALTDEINSIENAKHVQRTMQENARQNFWNGSVAPLGYRTVVAEIRGLKQKKRLEIDPETSETIRLIFRLYLEGDGVSGPLGIKNTVKYLNMHGFKTPRGNLFYTSYVEKILKDETYAGRAFYNVRDTRRKVTRPREEWIAVAVPPYFSEEEFQRVQSLLTLRNPRIMPPRIVNSSVLLTGLVVCGGCGKQMQRQSGKGGKYHYYRCSMMQRTGVCDGRTPAGINAEVLDNIVLSRLSEQILIPERVQAIVAEVAQKRDAGSVSAATTLRQLREQHGKVVKKLSKLISLLAEGIVEASDTFKVTVKEAEADSERLKALVAAQERLTCSKTKEITFEVATDFCVTLSAQLASCAPALKKRIIRSFVKHVVITDDEIVIIGAEADLAEVVTGSLIK